MRRWRRSPIREQDPDRRAWHRAHAAAGPDEEVAAELERSAGRAQARGGIAAAAAFLERATALTLDPVRRTERALAAASAKVRAGAFDAARDLLSIAEAGPLSDFQQARIDLIGAELAFLTNRGSEAPPLLLKAARRLKPIDAELSRATYLQALTAGYYCRSPRPRRGRAGGGARRRGRAAAAPRAARTRSSSGWPGRALHQGYAAGLPILRKALDAFGTGMSVRRSAALALGGRHRGPLHMG